MRRDCICMPLVLCHDTICCYVLTHVHCRMRDLADVASDEARQLRAESQARASEARDAEVLASAAEGRARLLQLVVL